MDDMAGKREPEESWGVYGNAQYSDDNKAAQEVMNHVAVRCSVMQCGAMWYSVLQCVAVCCSAMKCVEGAVCTRSDE